MSTLHVEPWRELDPALAELIEPELPGLRDEILAVIAEAVPEYARPLEGSFGRGLRLGVDEALRQFARLVANPDGGRAQSREVYLGLGRGEMREGRGLEALQAAYRIGARVAWRRLSAAGLRARLSPETLCVLADAIFAYIDELAADSVEGFAQAQQAAAGERERRRRRALTALLSSPFEPDALRAAASDAAWDVPKALALLACEPANLERIALRLPTDVLAGLYEELGCIVVRDPDGPGRRAELERACDGRPAALGPTQPTERASQSWARAKSGLAAIRAGALGDSAGGASASGASASAASAAGALAGGASALCVVHEHLAELAFFEAREPLRELAARTLAPLDGLTPTARDRMTETLRAYLEQRGSAPAMAQALHVHPQTVRYRLRKLRDLFGDTLDDPDARFQLETALRAGRV